MWAFVNNHNVKQRKWIYLLTHKLIHQCDLHQIVSSLDIDWLLQCVSIQIENELNCKSLLSSLFHEQTCSRFTLLFACLHHYIIAGILILKNKGREGRCPAGPTGHDLEVGVPQTSSVFICSGKLILGLNTGWDLKVVNIFVWHQSW